jgi:hypothetical protein
MNQWLAFSRSDDPVHIVIPMLFAFILIGIIQGRAFDAVTWSSISHLMQSSWWVLLLQSDASAGNFFGKVIRWRVFGISTLVSFVTICLIVAGFLTPKPLYEKIVASNGLHDVDFAFVSGRCGLSLAGNRLTVADPSYYGRATLEPQSINRRCGWNLFIDCPYSIYDDATIRTKYVNHTVVNSTVPTITRELFISGTGTGTVANLFDIQFRAYNLAKSDYVDNNATRAIGRLEVLPSMILNGGYQIVNGLIIDAFHGGIGIRNHTVPKGTELGAVWTEDILWIIPESRCTDTNLSLHFSVNDIAGSSYRGKNGFLRDDGGLSRIGSQVPQPQWNKGQEWKKVSATPDLKRNADILAWWNNQFVAQALNITSSREGDIHSEELVTYGQMSDPGVLKISSVDGLFLDSLAYDKAGTPQYALESQFKDYGMSTPTTIED